MAFSNIALFAALLPAVFAMPQHAHMGHQHKGRQLLSAFPTGFPHPSGVSGSAPYPGGNSTATGPTGTSVVLSTGGADGGPVTIRSTLQIVPLPESTGAGGVGSSPLSGAGAIGNSPASSSPGSGSSPSGAPGSGSGQNGESCAAGPSTVTVTQANTVTVTVPAPSGGSGGNPSLAPVQSLPKPSSQGQEPSSAPFPMGSGSVPVGPTGTGTVDFSFTSAPYQSPIVSSTPVTSPPASSTPVKEQSTSAPASTEPASAQPASAQSAPAQSASVQAYSNPVQGPESNAPVSSDASPANLMAAPVADKPKKPSSSSSAIAASVISSATPASSSAAASTSTAPVSHGGKARGLLFGGNNGAMPPAEALSAANTYLAASEGAVGWCWNWDSSPSPAIGWATGNTNVEFVPMLWGLKGDLVEHWAKNVATTKPSYVMGFNEPDMTTDKGGCGLGVTDAVTAWKANMEPLASQGIKLVSPSTTNELTAPNMGLGYMTQFLSACAGCHFDALAFHYYGSASDMEALKATVKKYQALQQQHSIPELWITEMAPTEAPNTEQMAAFLKFLDDPSNGVARYAFNGLNTQTGQSVAGPVIKAAYQT